MPQLASTPEAAAVIKDARARLSAKPNALAKIHVEGTLPHQGIYDQSKAAIEDYQTMEELALAWRVTKEPAFLQTLTTYFNAWLDLYQPNFNPIDETRFDQVIFAYDLAGADLPPETQTKMKVLLQSFAEKYLAPRLKMGGVDTNNWQSHRVKLGTLAAFALGDQAQIDRAHEALQKQIAVNILRDGRVIDFQDRDALHYVTYDLEPLSVAVLAAKTHGLDWFHLESPKGATIPAAIDWLVPYAKGEKKHVEFVHSKVGFDAARAKAGVPGFTGEWEPTNALGLYALAAQIDPKYQPVYEHLLQEPDAHPAKALALLIKAGL